MADSKSLAQLRAEIDAVDDSILEALHKRAELARGVASIKAQDGADVYRPSRETEIVRRLERVNQADNGAFPTPAIAPVFREIISACRHLQKGVRVAFLGPEATFTHEAARRQFGSSTVVIPSLSIPAVFQQVERGGADFAVVPVENSTEGVVNHTLDSFLESPLQITAEIAMDIDHCLLAQAGVAESAIERVYSHPQALAQCRQWLTENLPRAALVETRSTAEAAQRVAQEPQAAAIAAAIAAEIYDINILRARIQDAVRNVTRFLVLGNRDLDYDATQVYKTTLLVALADESGALINVLQPMSDLDVNMTKIESRPSRDKLWDYVFFIDVDGHREDPSLNRLIETLRPRCRLLRVLGSYRKVN